MSAIKMRAFWMVGTLALVLVAVQVARSEPTASPKVFKNGDVLTAEDLNANFAGAVPTTSVPYVWSAFAQAQQDLGRLEAAYVSEGRVATFSFSSPVAGDVLLSASYEIRVRNSFESSTRDQCSVQTVVSDAQTGGFGSCTLGFSCNQPGFATNAINANLPTQDGAGTYLGLSQSVSRVLPLKQGLNTYYLIGRTNCPAGIWGAISFSAITVKNGGNATLSIP
ncbi:MAG TPA: hypothetical protein VFX59_12240 [Polyangiales bacterium]|nr:hypothetical protein [Polyangiales bacterium]